MNPEQKRIAQNCMNASHDGTADFPTILGNLAAAGLEGYLVDYRKGTSTYYLPSGESVEIENQKTAGKCAPGFNAAVVEENVRKSQAGAHTYKEFCENVKNAGCAGYLVSLIGRRVTYFGRTGETHVEHFPS